MQQRLPLAEEHEEPPEGRVRQGPQGVLPVLSPQDEVQEQPPEAHPPDSLRIIGSRGVPNLNVLVALPSSSGTVKHVHFSIQFIEFAKLSSILLVGDVSSTLSPLK